MVINPCGYPNCKDTDCENCRHNKIQEIPDEDEEPIPYDGDSEDYIPKDIMEEKKNKIIEKIKELLERTDYYDGYTDTKEVNGVLREALEIFRHD